MKVSGNLFIEFLHVSTGKNHIVLHVPLEEPVMMGQMVYYAVCVAMDLADKPFVALDDSERMEPSMMPRSRLAATFTRTNSTSSCSVQHAICHRAARVELRGPKDDPTVGALINVAKDASIYKFVFLAYTGFTEPKVWKGCRYFILQYGSFSSTKASSKQRPHRLRLHQG